MDCPSCNFINAPGTPACARCGSALRFEHVVAMPPRAREAFLPLPLRLRLYRTRQWVSEDLRRSFARMRAALAADTPLEYIAASLLLPGLGHYLTRRPRTGHLFLGVWLILLTATILFLGSGQMWLPAMMTLGWHSFSVSILTARSLALLTIPQRMAVGLGIYLLILTCFYGPARLLQRQLIEPLELPEIASTDTLQTGDVVWCAGPWLARPVRAGDLVLREIPADGTGPVVIVAGLTIDRVIGLPGDVIECDGFSITRNGSKLDAAQGPLRPLRIPPRTFELQPDEFLVIPSTLRVRNNAINANVVISTIAAHGCISSAQIRNRVIFRTLPLHRFGFINTEEPGS